ncbi:MAG TPA: PEP-CTERM sorting domain-containing protein [Verrucomicrobiales bacterium]|jgi:hypothetical protein|nr:PEP-CTERM sorting domain-containing protein [Verrucomicrobiales bacterium]
MRKIAQLTVASLLASASLSSAALVNIATNSWSGAAPKVILTTGGQRLATDSIVRIGTFPTGVPQITPTTPWSVVNSAFVPLGESAADAADGTNGPLFVNNVNTLNPGDAQGHFAGTINGVDNADARFGAGTRLYIMVLNAPFASMSSANQITILSDATGFTIPSSATRTMTTSAIDTAAEVFAGQLGANSITMVPFNVPEPSTGMLGLLAAAGLMARRRR